MENLGKRCQNKNDNELLPKAGGDFSKFPALEEFHQNCHAAYIKRTTERSVVVSNYDRAFTKFIPLMYKINNNLSPTLMKSIFPESTNQYNLRRNNLFQTCNVYSVYKGTETFSFRGAKTWAIVPDEIKNCSLLTEFKQISFLL